MNTLIEGRQVAPDLINAIQQPHIVPVHLYHGELSLMTARTDVPVVQGTFEGWIPRKLAEEIPGRIRNLTKAILYAGVGVSPSSIGRKIHTRFIQLFGHELLLHEGLEHSPDLARGEMRMVVLSGKRHAPKVSVAEEDYILPAHVWERRQDHLTVALDTGGHWITSSLVDSDGKGEEMAISERNTDGRFMLRKHGDGTAAAFKDGIAAHVTEFLPVAPLSADLKNLEPLSHRLTIALETYNTLRAVHKTCIGEQGLLK